MKVVAANSRVEPLIREVEEYFSRKENPTIDDKRNIIRIVEYAGERYVVKSFKVPHLINRIVYRYFRDSKAKRSYENSLRLKALGVDTPDPAGYAEERSVRGLGRSYFVSAYLPFDFEIRALFADPRFPRRDEILEAFVKFAWELHEKGVYHVDFSPGNILVKEEGKGYRFYLVDVNRMRFGPLGAQERMQSLSKLTSSEEDNRTMVALYAGYSGWDEEELLRYHRKALRRQREYLERKRRLKSLFNPLRKRG